MLTGAEWCVLSDVMPDSDGSLDLGLIRVFRNAAMPADALTALCTRIVTLGTEISGRELVTSYWGLVKVAGPGSIPAAVHAALQQQMVGCASAFNAQDLAMSLWVLASVPPDRRSPLAIDAMTARLPDAIRVRLTSA